MSSSTSSSSATTRTPHSTNSNTFTSTSNKNVSSVKSRSSDDDLTILAALMSGGWDVTGSPFLDDDTGSGGTNTGDMGTLKELMTSLWAKGVGPLTIENVILGHLYHNCYDDTARLFAAAVASKTGAASTKALQEASVWSPGLLMQQKHHVKSGSQQMLKGKGKMPLPPNTQNIQSMAPITVSQPAQPPAGSTTARSSSATTTSSSSASLPATSAATPASEGTATTDSAIHSLQETDGVQPMQTDDDGKMDLDGNAVPKVPSLTSFFLEPSIDVHMRDRQTICHLILNGSVEQAVTQLQNAFPGLLETSRDLHFELACQWTVELMRAGMQTEEGYSFVQKHLTPVFDPSNALHNSKYEDLLMMILFYPYPQDFPARKAYEPVITTFFEQQSREELAAFLNATILGQLLLSKHDPLDRIIRQLIICREILDVEVSQSKRTRRKLANFDLQKFLNERLGAIAAPVSATTTTTTSTSPPTSNKMQ